MKRRFFVGLVFFLAMCSIASALYSVSLEGKWPSSWAKELEPFRKQARTYVGPTVEQPHHVITFTKREDFETAWPHILKVKTKGAPVFLVRGPSWLGQIDAGVCVHCPPEQNTPQPEKPIAGGDPNNAGTWMYTTCIELVVDGNVVDLNRIPLPADTPIIDKRFPEAKQKR